MSMKRLLTFASFLLLPLLSQGAPSGQQLYETHCAVCHGLNGNGGVGVPLALPDFQYGITDEFLNKTIHLGRPGRVMPSFDHLEENEIAALVKYIRHWAPGKPIIHAEKKITGNVERGKQLYQQRCASCHGANGEGGMGTGVTFSRPRDLPIIPPALNNSGFLAAASDQEIKAALMNGREGTPMVSFLKNGMSEQQIDDVVSYVRSFENNPLDKQKHVEITDNVISYESPYSLQETVDAIKRAAIGKNFRIIRVQPLDQGLVEEGKENQSQVIIYFCNFQLLNDALAVDPRVGLFLPCRVTVVEEKGKVNVLAVNPKRLSVLFNNYELDRLCSEMQQTYESIIEEATL
jgi:cytochrome c oxidase cbb3-type subunit 3